MAALWDIETVNISVSKHFSREYLRLWGWDFHQLRDALRQAYKIEKVGKIKYEIYVQKHGYKKIICVYDAVTTELFCITGSEGGFRI